QELTARNILSSAGAAETLRLCDAQNQPVPSHAGQLSFVESLSILARPPKSLGCDRTIVFFNDSEKFHWQKPDSELCDPRTGVICSPNNFAYSPTDGELTDNLIRITSLANFPQWNALPEEQYRLEKLRWYDRLAASAVR